MRFSAIVRVVFIVSLKVFLAFPVKGQNMALEKVTIGLKKEPLTNAIRKIEQQTSFRFYYREADIKALANLDLPEGTRTVEQTLQELLKNTIFSFRQIGNSILLEKADTQTSYEIKGRVLGNTHNAIDLATVCIKKKDMDKIIQSATTDTSGNFKLTIDEKGAYIIKITATGMDSLSVDLIVAETKMIQLPDIILTPFIKSLKEVAVVGKKPFIEQKIDRTIVNVDALISNAGTTALDVLDKSPGVEVDQNGTISLKGKPGVVIFIDDKPTYLSGADLQNYLKSIPSSSLDQVEIMTNPPAKYDAAGNAGVINIRTKKTRAKGFNGNINLAYAEGRDGSTNNSMNFNYRRNKLNFFGTLSYNYQNGFYDIENNRRYENADESTKSYFIQHTYVHRTSKVGNTKIGVDYYQSDKTTWGIVLSGMLRSTLEQKMNTSNFLDVNNQLDSDIVAHNVENSTFKNGGVNLNYRHQYNKKGRELTADLDYLKYYTKYNQVFNNDGYLPNQTLTFQDQLLSVLPSHLHIYAVKTDYTHPAKRGFTLGVGVKSSYTQTNNLSDYFNVVNNIATPDYDKSNHFIYKENINAGYINLNKDWKSLSIQAGMRLENTISTGHQLGNIMKPDSSFRRNYTSLFPTVYFLYKFDSAENNQLGLHYGRRINRPYYQDLDPYITPVDKFTYYAGNPFLDPSFSNNIELSHTYKNRITTTLGYGKTTGNINETIVIINGIYYSSPGNIGSTITKTISVSAGFDLAKWFSCHFYSEWGNIHSKSNFSTGLLDRKGDYFLIRPLFQFNLDKGWNLQLDGNYRSKLTNAQFVTGSTRRISVGVAKKVSTASTLKLSINDIFYTIVYSGTINNVPLTELSFRNKSDSRQVILAFSYRVGKAIANQRKHDTNGAESEQSRVRN